MFIGYDDGSKSVKHYNAETRKILTSRNFCFLTSVSTSPPEGIVVAPPDVPFKGEYGVDKWHKDANMEQMPRSIVNNKRDAVTKEKQEPSSTIMHGQLQNVQLKQMKRKQRDWETSDQWEPQKTHGKHIDYRHLNDPFSDDDDKNQAAQYIYPTSIENVLGHDDPKTLEEARNSPKWPKWEKAIKAELDQLAQKGTWVKIKNPETAIPIANKWVFIKKYNKEGNLTKYKARLVAKGCAQCPGHDYLETFSPVVCMETIRAVLALSAIKDFVIQQMDVKGAYLNGTLKEKVYMHQPDGYADDTERVCKLIKMLYGLKQSGCEWNKELDIKLKKHNFRHL
jgi:hypothetical protein